MKNTRQSPKDAILKQHIEISKAIEILTSELNKMTDSIDPDNANWKDVGEFARTAEIARDIIEQFQEN